MILNELEFQVFISDLSYHNPLPNYTHLNYVVSLSHNLLHTLLTIAAIFDIMSL